MTAPAITVANVSYTYPDGRQAIREVSLRLGEGESLGLIGPNGAGKTTLLSIIAGLSQPQTGAVEIFSRTFDGKQDAELRRRLGFVFQESEDQLFSSTVFDDVAFGPLNFGLPLDDVRSRVEEALRQVGLEGFGDRVPHHLSSGERQKVAIATVLSYRPDVLMLDEPTSDLDPRSRHDLVHLLRATSQARIVASHDLEFVLRTCQRVMLLDEGSVITEGITAEIFGNHDLLKEHGVEAPLGLRGLDAAELRQLLEDEGE